jgi:hypothetical protein
MVEYRRQGSDPERERRHLAFINNANNAEAFAEATLEWWREVGRGFWTTSDQMEENTDATTAFTYVPLSEIGRFPDDQVRAKLERMLRTYDPRYQVVFVIEEEGTVSLYKTRLVRPTSN